MDTSRITRFEVISPLGVLTYVEYGVQVGLSLQDDGRTLKVFISPHPVKTRGDVVQEMKAGIRAAMEQIAPSLPASPALASEKKENNK